MRVFSGKYYANLFRLVAEFNVPAKPRRFLFVFSREGEDRPYFIHASNVHRAIPPLPITDPSLVDRVKHYSLILIVAFCYAIFTIGCYIFPPRVSMVGEASETETIKQYCNRLLLPDFFLNDYLVPLFSSVATCSHEDFRNFPAVYITDYKKYTAGNDHSSVTTMQAVQSKLVSNGLRVKLRHPVTKIESESDGSVRLTHVDLDNGSTEHVEVFSKVITATSSHALAKLYEPARPMASQLPICEAEVVVHCTARPSSTQMSQLTYF
jgi:Flavin containing amine oxidoreductase